MNNINRPLVKQQAKQLIKEKVFFLFLISAVALILTTGLTTVFQVENNLDAIDDFGYFDRFDDRDDDHDDIDDFDDFFERNYNSDNNTNGNQNRNNSSDNPIESFGKADNQSFVPDNSNAVVPMGIFHRIGVSSNLLSVLGLVLSPLLITLFGFYVMFVRKNPQEELNLGAEISNLFKTSFDGSYVKKLVVYILRNLFTALWSLLFIIPGIVFHYSSYFAFQLMYEYPNLKPAEAIKLSKKIVKGNRTELLLLDLSFIPWYLLCGITVGIASIYVIPYVMTTQALYYENFRNRALAEGRITNDDFLSIDELTHKYSADSANQGQQFGQQQYYNPYEAAQNTAQNYYTPNSQGNTQQSYYYHPEPQQTPQPEPQAEEYYTPPQSAPQAQTEEYYTPPQSEPQAEEYHTPEPKCSVTLEDDNNNTQF